MLILLPRAVGCSPLEAGVTSAHALQPGMFLVLPRAIVDSHMEAQPCMFIAVPRAVVGSHLEAGVTQAHAVQLCMLILLPRTSGGSRFLLLWCARNGPLGDWRLCAGTNLMYVDQAFSARRNFCFLPSLSLICVPSPLALSLIHI